MRSSAPSRKSFLHAFNGDQSILFDESDDRNILFDEPESSAPPKKGYTNPLSDETDELNSFSDEPTNSAPSNKGYNLDDDRNNGHAELQSKSAFLDVEKQIREMRSKKGYTAAD